MRADCSSYIITTSMTTRLHNRETVNKRGKETERERERRKKKKLIKYIYNNQCYENYIISLVKVNVLHLNSRKRMK